MIKIIRESSLKHSYDGSGIIYRVNDRVTGECYDETMYDEKQDAVDAARQAHKDTGEHFDVEQYTYASEEDIGNYEPEDIRVVYSI